MKRAALLLLLVGGLCGCGGHATEEAAGNAPPRTRDASACRSACTDAAPAKCTERSCRDGGNVHGPTTTVSRPPPRDAGVARTPSQPDASTDAGVAHRDAAADSALPGIEAGAGRCTPADPVSAGCYCANDFATESMQFGATCGSAATAPHSGQPLTCGSYDGFYFQGFDASRAVFYDRKTGGLAGMMEVGVDAVVHCYSFDPGFTTPLDVFSASGSACVSACPASTESPGHASCQGLSSDVSHNPPALGGPACTADFRQCTDGRTYRALCTYEGADAGSLRIRCDCLVNGLDSGSFFFTGACPVGRAAVDAGCGWAL